jgi:hypothetical protein
VNGGNIGGKRKYILKYLNIVNNNFLGGTNYNYSCILIISPGKCKTDYVMPELRTINSMLNISSYSTIVVLLTK